jgi:hypothetical protein
MVTVLSWHVTGDGDHLLVVGWAAQVLDIGQVP